MKQATLIDFDRVSNPMPLEPIYSHSDNPFLFGIIEELGKSSDEYKQLLKKIYMSEEDPRIMNHGMVCFHIGEEYLNGDGVEHNFDKAIYWIELGASYECNDDDVCERLVIKKLAAMFLNPQNPLHAYAKKNRLISENKPWRPNVLIMRLIKHYKNLKCA